jgi:hypothetical protein
MNFGLQTTTMPTKRPLCYSRSRGPTGPPLPPDFKSNAPNAGIVKNILDRDLNIPIVSNFSETYDMSDIKCVGAYFKTNHCDSKMSDKPVYPRYMEDIGDTFEEYVAWAKKHNWTDEQIEELYRKKEERENSIEDRNNHLENVFTRFVGKSSTTKPKPKPLRTRFKVKKLTIDIGEEDEDEGTTVPESQL